jgi:hypothetical protein
MPRSGSTWLYNVVRFCCELSGKYVSAGWVEDYLKLRDAEIIVLKTHEIKTTFDYSYTFYSYRDLRDVVASYKRQSGNIYSMQKLKRMIDLDGYWRKKANFTMRYEVMIKCPKAVIEKILSVFDIKNLNVYDILEKMDKLIFPESLNKSFKYDKTSLLHPNHITNGNKCTWEEIDVSFIKKIETEFKQWFKDNGYL